MEHIYLDLNHGEWCHLSAQTPWLEKYPKQSLVPCLDQEDPDESLSWTSEEFRLQRVRSLSSILALCKLQQTTHHQTSCLFILFYLSKKTCLISHYYNINIENTNRNNIFLSFFTFTMLSCFILDSNRTSFWNIFSCALFTEEILGSIIFTATGNRFLSL